MEEYFTQLFTATNTEWSQVTYNVSSRVTSDQNEMLLLKVDEKEVKAALFNMYPDKSPGPDEMTPGFYQKCQNIVKEDVVTMVQQFFESGSIDDHLRGTNIALIPKKLNPTFMTDLRHISLCNVL